MAMGSRKHHVLGDREARFDPDVSLSRAMLRKSSENQPAGDRAGLPRHVCYSPHVHMGIRSRVTTISALCGAICLVACGSSDQSSLTLTGADVSNLPPGNAVGTSFSGTYLLKDGKIAACECRVNECSRWSVSRGDTFTFTETNGSLHVLLHSTTNTAGAMGQMYDGGINRGGDFRAGSTLVRDGGTFYALLSGTLVPGVSADVESRTTTKGKVAGEDFDCDLVLDATLSYLSSP